ncbi:MAG: phosphate acyltransferase [Marinibacterium sp.]
MSVLDTLSAQAQHRSRRVVFADWADPRVAQAVDRLEKEHLCEALPVAPASPGQTAALISARGVSKAVAARMLARPLYRAAAMVAAGEADALVAGAAVPTRRVIEAASIAIGLQPGVGVASSFFLMLFPDGRELIFADCALNVDPDAERLAEIARATAASATALFGRAEVALLSYSTGTSGAGASVEKVAAAADLTGFSGPVQGDAALNCEIAARKGMGSGQANTLIFPTLDAGNIAYKLAQELAGAQALGPILQGFAKPVCDLSRGAQVDDIVASTLVTLALG